VPGHSQDSQPAEKKGSITSQGLAVSRPFLVEVYYMRLTSSPKVMAVTFITIFFIFNHTPFYGITQETTDEITTITGGRIDPVKEAEELQAGRTRISGRILELFSDVYAYSSEAGRGRNSNNFYHEASTDLLSFIGEVFNGQAGEVRGVHVDGVFSLPVFQQPDGDIAYVSDNLGEVTEFQSAARNNVIGLLAHNFLSGDLFYNLELGHEVIIVYGDGAIRRYQVYEFQQFERLDRVDLRSDFIELETGLTLTSDEVFSRFYRGQHKVTFQTCLKRYGISNWGLQFAVAAPLDPFPLTPYP
jgi:hypothetical protein